MTGPDGLADGGELSLRISELSRRTGVPVATIKFYLREKLLPPGHPTGRNQARYGDEHLRRLFLIRTFTSFGELDLATVRSLLAIMGDTRVPLAELYTAAARRSGRPEPDPDDEAFTKARADACRLAETQGWAVDADAAAFRHFTQVLVALRQLECAWDVSYFEPFAQAADRLADHELSLLDEYDEGADPIRLRAASIARALLFEVALSALRRMALQDRLSARAAVAPLTAVSRSRNSNSDGNLMVRPRSPVARILPA